MKMTFSSKFPPIKSLIPLAQKNNGVILSGFETYINFACNIGGLNQDDSKYIPIRDMYDSFCISPFVPMSKRSLYENYNSGIVVGAGSGRDCDELIGNLKWGLFDLTDERMINEAVGYKRCKGSFNIASSAEGDAIVNISNKYRKGTKEIEFATIDTLYLSECGIISIDAEGSGLDVLAGSMKMIERFRPDLLVSIYHNWQEYLLIPPMLYDMGYEIEVIQTPNFTPQQPHLELSLLCKKKT